MRFARLLAVGLCSLVLASSTFAQAKAAPAAAKDDVLSLVPAGSMGVAVIGNVQATADKLDKFLADLGIPIEGTLDMVLAMTNMKDGFRPEGGFAVVMLDPQQFGIDLVQKIQAAAGMDDGDGDDSSMEIPFAVYFPGKSAKDLFANSGITKSKDSKYQQIAASSPPAYVVEHKGYVIVSPMPKVLDAIVGSKKAITSTMTKEQLAAMAGNDLAIFLDMKIAGPLLSKLMDIQQAMSRQIAFAGPLAALVQFRDLMSQMQREAIEQTDSFLLGAKFVPEGVVVEYGVVFAKGSDAAKANAEIKPLGKEQLSKLPAKNYIFAMDSMCAAGPQTDKARDEFLAAVLSNDLLSGLNDGDKTKLMDIIQVLSTQVTRGQCAIGGAAGEGALAVTWVLQVKDSARFTATMKDTVKLVNKLINDAIVEQFGKQGAAQIDVGLVYKAGASKQGAVNVDEISAKLPDGAIDESVEAILTQVIGDSTVRFLLACPDKTTVVITLGGSEQQMAEAIKTATKGGGVDVSKAQVNGLKYMPENRSAVGAFHIANFLKAIRIAADTDMIPELQADAPLTFAVAASGNQLRAAFFVPTAAIQEIVQLVTHRMMPFDYEIDDDDDDDDDDSDDDDDDDDDDYDYDYDDDDDE